MKVLILALSGIGDALMFTPAVKLIRKNLPEAQIDALVMFKGVKDMYDRNPHLSNVIHFDFMKEGAARSLKFVLSLRGKYDYSINVYPANRKEYNVINWLIGARKRAGAKYLRKNFSNLGFLNNITVLENDNTHNVQTNIKLVSRLFGFSVYNEPSLEFPLNENDINYADKFFQKNKISEERTVIGFHPGCATLKNHIKRRWEPEKFASLAVKLINNQNAKILIFGGPEEKDLKENILKQINNENASAVYTDDLPQSAAIMKRCNLFITNDSSLMHISSALKLNVVAIIGPTNPAYIHPWKTDHKIVTLNLDCAPCFIYSPRPLICFRNDVKFKCIKELTVDMVYNSAMEFLERPRLK